VPSTRFEAEFHDHPDRLPADATALFSQPNDDFYATSDWYRLVLAHALPEGASARFVVIRLDGHAAALLPLLRLADGTLQSLTTPYTCLYRPLLAPNLDATSLRQIGRALATYTPLRLEALDAETPALAPLCAGLRDRLKLPLRFDHFGNWHENVAGMGWAAYLATRDGALRETIRRRTARIARTPGLRLELTRGDNLDCATQAFETVYASSWKQPEPYPHFNPGLIRLAAAQGVLRLGILWHHSQPIAVQLWIVTGRCASVLKLAHVEAHKALSPGTVLTAHIIRSLLDHETIDELDFGRGDDPYKIGWAASRRQRIGLMAIDPLRPAGLAILTRHLAGRLLRRLPYKRPMIMIS
jgi:CelD/BcsL family acetyltransferase involved in cellulose biosynthesis